MEFHPWPFLAGRKYTHGVAQAGYQRNEIAFLLSLDRQQALEYASGMRDSIGHLTEERGHSGFSPDDTDVPFIAMWAEVNAAAARIKDAKANLALLHLRLQGYTDEEIATELKLGRVTVGRRWRATLEEILNELGGEAEPIAMALDHIDMCTRCGVNPRTRVRRRARIWTNGRWRWKRVERPSSMCASCLETDHDPGLAVAA